jgi:hypothetical protein
MGERLRRGVLNGSEDSDREQHERRSHGVCQEEREIA